jgi:dTDP-4-dehydrorhamnose reductase
MSTTRVLVTGANGLLGQKMTELLVRGSGYTVTTSAKHEKPVRPVQSVTYTRMDITSRKDVKRVIASCEPDVIINCAALTGVDACEKERELAWKVNVGGVENLIEAAHRTDATIVQISTDYIFDGKAGPYDEHARPEPVNYYGKSKLAAENAVRASGFPYLIARTMVLYGFGHQVKSNFALWLIDSLSKKVGVRVVDDQTGNPTLVDDLAFGLLNAIELGRTGIYNIAGRDIVSRYAFAVRLAKAFELNPQLITPVKTSALHQPAPRPLKSGLITLKAEVELGYKPSTIEEGLTVLKGQIKRGMRHFADSSPIPGVSSRSSKR